MAAERVQAVTGRLHVAALLTAVAVSVGASACGSDGAQPWKGDAHEDAHRALSVAPAASAVPDEPLRATNPAQAPSPGGTNPDGSTFGTTAPQASGTALKQDRAAMLLLRTTVSIVEGCHSGRSTYVDCDEQHELGDPAKLGITVGDGDDAVRITATPNSVRLTVRSRSGARFTVARSAGGDRFSCDPGGSVGGACPETHTWEW